VRQAAERGNLALSPNGILCITTAATDTLAPSLYAINLR
jgi:hypothetical protein